MQRYVIGNEKAMIADKAPSEKGRRKDTDIRKCFLTEETAESRSSKTPVKTATVPPLTPGTAAPVPHAKPFKNSDRVCTLFLLKSRKIHAQFIICIILYT